MQTGDSRESSIWIIFIGLGAIVLIGGGGALYTTLSYQRAARVAQVQQQSALVAQTAARVVPTAAYRPVFGPTVTVSIASADQILGSAESDEQVTFQLVPTDPTERKTGREVWFSLPDPGTYRVLAWYRNLFGVSEPLVRPDDAPRAASAPPIVLRPGLEIEGTAPKGTKRVLVRFEGTELEAEETRHLRGALVREDGSYRVRGVPAAGVVEIVTESGQVLQTLEDGRPRP